MIGGQKPPVFMKNGLFLGMNGDFFVWNCWSEGVFKSGCWMGLCDQQVGCRHVACKDYSTKRS
ncbi:hypothetical protein [Bacillus sp. KH172YL63]|uniref:hypothetical protein n=1 Tax=Bacillus sp. KH172YL63 TaxID=2709784 RepID=UPI001563468C|nr:hypothetical protein [Bacillus sp. KH172YL63]